MNAVERFGVTDLILARARAFAEALRVVPHLEHALLVKHVGRCDHECIGAHVRVVAQYGIVRILIPVHAIGGTRQADAREVRELRDAGIPAPPFVSDPKHAVGADGGAVAASGRAKRKNRLCAHSRPRAAGVGALRQTDLVHFHIAVHARRVVSNVVHVPVRWRQRDNRG